MKLLEFLPGGILLEITCADCAGILNALNAHGIALQNVCAMDDLTLRVRIRRQDADTVLRLVKKHGGKCKIIHTFGLFKKAEAAFQRPVLAVFCVLLFFACCYLPQKVLFVSVEGNKTLPARYILEAASECGIRFGAQRSQVRSETMKNTLLERIPQLQWAGINTSGCTAIISVREKTQQEEMIQTQHQVTSIVASRDGVIQNCTVYRGNPLCTVGQAVKAGQILVSGYLDCGIVTKAMQADAEIRALTFREVTAIAPLPDAQRGVPVRKTVTLAIRIGKKRINFTKDSGNSDAICGKMYSEEYVCLPGGFRLPVAIVRETVFHYEKAGEAPTAAQDSAWLDDFAQSYLKDIMISGEIISAQTQAENSGNANYFYGKFACLEMIGQVRQEAPLPKDDNHDRTNR